MYGWFLLPRFGQSVVLSPFELSSIKIFVPEARVTLGKTWHLTELHLKNEGRASLHGVMIRRKGDEL